MKNFFEHFRPFRRRRHPLAGIDTPCCAEHIDLDRVIWDPKYREDARVVLSREAQTAANEEN